MTDIARHVRIFNPEPSDDLVTKRTSAISKLSTRLTKLSTARLLQYANDLSVGLQDQGALTDGLQELTEREIRRSAEAFIADGHELEILVCASLAAARLIQNTRLGEANQPKRELLALALWSALSFQLPSSRPQLETLRAELLEEGQKVVLKAASLSRQRTEVPDVALTLASEYSATGLRNSLSGALNRPVQALRSNAVLDREEIDFLWWCLRDWSDLLEQPYSCGDNSAALAIASGLEVGGMLKCLPASAHRHLVLRNVDEKDPLNLVDLCQTVTQLRDRLVAPYGRSKTIRSNPVLFPLLHALQFSANSSPPAQQQRTLSEWSARALLESSMAELVLRLDRNEI